MGRGVKGREVVVVILIVVEEETLLSDVYVQLE